jgi:diguanylate cyclase (GGDEF)-like protein
VNDAVLWLSGVAVGALAGWAAAAQRAGRRRQPPGTLAPPLIHDPPDETTVVAMRASDAVEGLPPDPTLEVIARLLADRASERAGPACAVALRDTVGGPIEIVAVSSGLDARLVGESVDPDSPAGRAVTDGVPVVASENQSVVHADTRDRRRPIRGGVAVPIRSPQFSYVAGAVLVLGAPPPPATDVVHQLETLVRRFAPVLLPAQAVKIARQRAATDELTTLSNRRALKDEMDAGDRWHSALILLDLDHFKEVNDTLGHAAGDVALKHVARILRECLRDGDVAARVGGEEFAVWLPGADLPLALEIAERLRALVEQQPFRYQGSAHALTISCGVTACPAPAVHPDNLMSTADAALYQAKRDGRNRVVASRGKRG